MRVYRVEDKNGEGPYRGRNMLCDMAVRHNNPTYWPTPKEDIDLLPPQCESLLCGFATLKQYRAWFNETDRKDLRKKFKLSVYNVKKRCVHRGEKQIVFDICEATLLERRKIEV